MGRNFVRGFLQNGGGHAQEYRLGFSAGIRKALLIQRQVCASRLVSRVFQAAFEHGSHASPVPDNADARGHPRISFHTSQNVGNDLFTTAGLSRRTLAPLHSSRLRLMAMR